MLKDISALCPANGWWAAYEEEDRKVMFQRVAVFAAVKTPAIGENDEETFVDEVVGMDALDLMDFGHCGEASNFVGYYHDSDFDIIGIALNGYAEKRLKNGGR